MHQKLSRLWTFVCPAFLLSKIDACSKFVAELLLLLATIAELSLVCGSSIRALLLSSLWTNATTSLKHGTSCLLRTWILTWSYSGLTPPKSHSPYLAYEVFKDSSIFGTYGFYHSIVVKFLPRGFQLIGIFSNNFISLFCGHYFHFDLLYLSRISIFSIRLLNCIPTILDSSQKIHVSLISGVIEFHSHAIIIIFFIPCFQGSTGFGPVPMGWMIFHFFFLARCEQAETI